MEQPILCEAYGERKTEIEKDRAREIKIERERCNQYRELICCTSYVTNVV